MFNVPLPIIIISAVLLLGAFICLLLEVAGTKEGSQNIGKKPHIIAVALLFVAAVAIYITNTEPVTTGDFIVFDSTAKTAGFFACIMILIALTFSISKKADNFRDCGENYALLLISLLLVIITCSTIDLLYLTLCLSLWFFTAIGIASCDKSRQAASEIAVKLSIKAVFILIFLVLATNLAYFCCEQTNLLALAEKISDYQVPILAKIAWSIHCICFLTFLGLTPFSLFHVDYIDGAPSFSALAFISGSFIAGGAVLLRTTNYSISPNFNSESLMNLLWFFTTVGLLIPGLQALDQRRISRMCIYLLMLQPALILALGLTFPSLNTENNLIWGLNLTNLCFSVPSVILGLKFLQIQNVDMTWEDYAGAGRKYPFIVSAWLITLSSLAGVPGTLGFYLRFIIVKKAFTEQNFIIGIIILFSVILSAVSIARLSVFLFTKPANYQLNKHAKTKPVFVILFSCFIILFAGMLPEVVKQAISAALF